MRLPNEDEGEDEDAGDDEELLSERRTAPAALQWGRGPGSGVYVKVRAVA